MELQGKHCNHLLCEMTPLLHLHNLTYFPNNQARSKAKKPGEE
jgi:hypothetical protein